MNNLLTWFTSDWWTSIDGVITIVTLIAVGFNGFQSWRRSKNQFEKVKIVFDVNGVDYLLDLDMPRKHISRSEIQGILAAFQIDIKGFLFFH